MSARSSTQKSSNRSTPPTKVDWIGPSSTRASGNFLGFTVAGERARLALGRRVQLAKEAQTKIHWGSPFTLAEPQKGKFNVCYTMYENFSLPKTAVEVVDKFDLVVVPSLWCKKVFARYTSKPIEVCPLGVDPKDFPYRRRRLRAGKKFRFLYLGAPNPRKFTILPELHRVLLSQLPDSELYLKTTGGSLASAAPLIANGIAESDGDIVRGDGWVVDNRKLPQKDLLSLYHSANAFLLLTCGEGFGLTGLEALSTGLPLIVSDWSGVTEYANSRNAMMVRCNYGDHRDKFVQMGFDGERPVEEEPFAFHVGWPDLQSAAAAAHMVYSNYPSALKKARRGAEMAAQFSWDSTARGLCDILKKYGIL